MYTAFLTKHRLALICAASIVVIGGCFMIYQSAKNKNKRIQQTANQFIKASNPSQTESNNTNNNSKYEHNPTDITAKNQRFVETPLGNGYILSETTSHYTIDMDTMITSIDKSQCILLNNNKPPKPTDIRPADQTKHEMQDDGTAALLGNDVDWKAESEKETKYFDDGTAALLGDDVDWRAESEKETKYYDDKKQNDIPKDKSIVKFPVQVFVRLRPLIKEEIEQKHEKFEYNTKYIKKTKSTTININDITKKQRKSAIKRPGKKTKDAKVAIKKFTAFKYVLSAEDNNNETFKQCILPSIGNVFLGFTVCSFAYGHTGSGKTHTIMGYDKQISPGMYSLTVKHICEKLTAMNKTIDNSDDQILLSCRFAELYQGKMRDLFGNLVECHVREDDEGNINIRGPTIKDEQTGQVKVQPLTPIYVNTNDTDKLIDKVIESLKLRKQGSSATHDESSRSHVFLEIELVTNKLVQERINVWNAEGELVPVGKARDEQLILIQSKQFVKDEVTGQYTVIKDYVPEVAEKEKLEKLQKEFVILERNVENCEKKVDEIMKNSDKCIGGSIVFVDLAGNEWGSDSKKIKNDNKIQASERKEINKSLLSLKECVRALHLHKDHVPYRDSKLTMVLRPHLKGINSTAIMIANISPSKEHILKTYNTLSYSQLVAKA